jgi:hypothetical protein
MTENNKASESEKEALPPTYCYSYEVTMVVQIFAQNEDQARTTLDASGGYVSKRDVVLKDTVSVYTGNNE